MQLKNGLARDKPTFMVIPLDSLENPRETILNGTLCLQEKYRDVMPDSLPKSLLPRRMIDHEIELLSGAKSPAKNANRMAPPKLAELWKQLDDLLSAGLLGLQKLRMGPQSFSRRRRMRVYGCVSTIVH